MKEIIQFIGDVLWKLNYENNKRPRKCKKCEKESEYTVEYIIDKDLLEYDSEKYEEVLELFGSCESKCQNWRFVSLEKKKSFPKGTGIKKEKSMYCPK